MPHKKKKKKYLIVKKYSDTFDQFDRALIMIDKYDFACGLYQC